MDLPESALEEYVKFESQHTPLNLSNKLSTFEQAEGTGTFPITVKVDFSKITEQDSRMLFMIPRLLMNLEREMNDEFGVQGTFEVGNIEIVIEDTQLVNMLLFKAAMKPQPQKKWIIK